MFLCEYLLRLCLRKKAEMSLYAERNGLLYSMLLQFKKRSCITKTNWHILYICFLSLFPALHFKLTKRNKKKNQRKSGHYDGMILFYV